MDQINLPDPVTEELALLQRENEELTNRLIDLEQDVRELKRMKRTEQ